MASAGLKVFPFDVREEQEYEGLPVEAQEECMANIIQKTIGRKKAVILVGAMHASREGYTIRSILESRGYRTLSNIDDVFPFFRKTNTTHKLIF